MIRDEAPSFLELLQITLLYWRVVLGTLVMGVLLSLVMVIWVIRPTYESQTSVLLISEKPKAGLQQVFSRLENQLGSLGSLGSMLYSQSNLQASSKTLKSILKSRTLADKILAQIDLSALPEVQKELKDAEPHEIPYLKREYLREHTQIKMPDNKEAALRVSVRLKDRILPAKIANLYIKEMGLYVRANMKKEETETKSYLKAKLKQFKVELAEAENQLLHYQNTHKRVALSEETRQYIKSLASIETESLTAKSNLKGIEAQLKTLKGRSTELSPESMVAQNELELESEGYRKQLRTFEQAQRKYTFILKKMPSQAMDLARLQRRLEMKNQMFLLISQQYQTLTLSSEVEPVLYQVLDSAIPSVEPVGPSKKAIILISAIMSICLGTFLSLSHYYVKPS